MPTIIETISELNKSIDTMPDDKKAMAVNSMIGLIKNVFGHLEIIKEAADHYRSDLFPAIVKQLSAAEKRTEKGIDHIMTACEKMSQDPALTAEATIKKTVQTYSNAIFEASNFQDLSAQHLNEVKLRLEEVNNAMTLFVDIMTKEPTQIAQSFAHYKRPRGLDAHLLNGPSTEDV